MNPKKFCHFFNFSINLFLIIYLLFLFIVVCNSETEDKTQIKSTSNVNSNVSSTHEQRHRERRAIRRGQPNYFQRSYDMNRLRYEKLEKSLRDSRHKPYFHRVNEVYSYYLPKKFNAINANIENFSNKDDNRLFGPKTRSFSTGKAERFAQTKEILPLDLYPPISRDINADRMGSLSTSTRVLTDPNINRYESKYEDYNSRTGISPESTDRYSRQTGRTSSTSRTSSSRSSSSATSALAPEPQNLNPNSTYPGIPGWLRSDFPGYATVPFTGFRCASQPYYGYYADVNAGCQAYHVCQPDGREYSFLCPNGTLYHQKVQTCDWWYYVDCATSPSFYYLNARIGVLPPIDSTLYRFKQENAS